MRDPDRIPWMIMALRSVWEKYPDLRLGQLIVNIAPLHKDLWDIEDDEMEQRIQKVLETNFFLEK